jgi:hypothetical protein
MTAAIEFAAWPVLRLLGKWSILDHDSLCGSFYAQV